MEDISRCSRADSPAVLVGAGKNSNLVKLLWLSSLPTKNNEDPIKLELARVVTTLYIFFLRHLRAANYAVGNGTWPKLKATHACLIVLVTSKN